MIRVVFTGESETFGDGSLVVRQARRADEPDERVVVCDFYIPDAPKTCTVESRDPAALANVGGELRENLRGARGPVVGADAVSTHYPVRVAAAGSLSVATIRECLAVALPRLVAASTLPTGHGLREFLTRQMVAPRGVAALALLAERCASRSPRWGIVP